MEQCTGWNGKRDSTLSRQPHFGKPTAAVRPSFGVHRVVENDWRRKQKENKDVDSISDRMERITGYDAAKTQVLNKPPIPPPSASRITNPTSVLKGRIASARKDFFERLNRQSESGKPLTSFEGDGVKCENSFARLDIFRRSAREERDRLAASHPDLGALEDAVRCSRRRIDALKKKNHVAGKSAPPDFNKPDRDAPSRPDRDLSSGGATTSSTTTALQKPSPTKGPYRRCTGDIAWVSCARRLRDAREKEKQRKSLSQSYLETDIDSHEQRPTAAGPLVDGSVRARSLLALSEALAAAAAQHRGEDEEDDDEADNFQDGKGDEFVAITAGEELLRCRARSMDFLLDEQNRESALPPENQLGSGQGRVKSEHELRVERSLQNLTIPEWYKRSAWSSKPKEGFILRRGSDGATSEASNRIRWKGFSSSRTPSASSLTSNSYSQRTVIIPKRITPATSTDWRYGSSLMSSRESLPPASPASLSPRDCGTFQYTSLSRWSSARLSTGSAPNSAWTMNRSCRQPYLGWRAAAASSTQTPTSCGSRSSPGISPAASSPVYGSRPASPRRSSQDHVQHHYQQTQVTSSANLRPDSGDGQDTSRISPLALYDNANGVFFNTELVVEDFDDNSIENVAYKINRAYDDKFRTTGPWPTLRRDRYSYTQSLYNPGVLISPGAEDNSQNTVCVQQEDVIVHQTLGYTDKVIRSPQLSPRVWMESSFVGTKKTEENNEAVKSPRNVSISEAEPSTTYSKATSTTSPLRSTCAPTKQMDTKELIEHLHSFLRNLQDRPMPTVSAFSYRPEPNLNGPSSSSSAEKQDDVPTLVDYDSEPKIYPRGSWRRSRGSSKEPSPASSTDNELWTSVCDDMIGRSRNMDLPDPLDSSHSVSPSSPPQTLPHATFFTKKAGLDDCPIAAPIFFASSRRSSKGSSDTAQQQISSRRSSRSESEGRRDSRSGSSSGGAGRRDSRTTLDSSSATGRDKDSKSASLEEVLDSLLAIPSSSRSSSPTSPRRSRIWQQRASAPSAFRSSTSSPFQTENELSQLYSKDQEEGEGNNGNTKIAKSFCDSLSRAVDDRTQEGLDVRQERKHQGKTFDDLPFLLPTTSTSSNSIHLPPTPSEEVDSEVNAGSFCRSPSLEDDGNHCRSSTSMEVLVPEGEDQEVSSLADERMLF